MELHYSHTNSAVDVMIDNLLEVATGIGQPHIIREMIITALKAGQESDYPADLKLILSTM